MEQMDQSALNQAMSLLGNLMVVRKRPPIHLVVCGGSALIALNLVTTLGQFDPKLVKMAPSGERPED